MKIMDAGVIGESFMDFTIPSNFAKRALYYIPQYGHFYCNENYCISRNSLEWLLFFYICEGTLHLESHKNRYTAGPDSIALLDCRTPHRYYCQDSVDFMWFHFCGNHSGAYADYLFEQHGVVFPPGHGETSRFQHIFSSVQSVSFSEHLVSADIHALLSSLAVSRQHHQAHHQPLSPAIDYIRTHFDQPVSLEDLADQCSMSTSHLIRSFQRYLNCTPHEYLLAFRLKQSKQLLLSTSMSIEQIAEQCGFNSASHFARAFRKNNGASPSAFRQVHF